MSDELINIPPFLQQDGVLQLATRASSCSFCSEIACETDSMTCGCGQSGAECQKACESGCQTCQSTCQDCQRCQSCQGSCQTCQGTCQLACQDLCQLKCQTGEVLPYIYYNGWKPATPYVYYNGWKVAEPKIEH